MIRGVGDGHVAYTQTSVIQYEETCIVHYTIERGWDSKREDIGQIFRL